MGVICQMSQKEGLNRSWELDEERVGGTTDRASASTPRACCLLTTVIMILPTPKIRSVFASVRMYAGVFSFVLNAITAHARPATCIQCSAYCTLSKVHWIPSIEGLHFLNIPGLVTWQLAPHLWKSLWTDILHAHSSLCHRFHFLSPIQAPFLLFPYIFLSSPLLTESLQLSPVLRNTLPEDSLILLLSPQP